MRRMAIVGLVLAACRPATDTQPPAAEPSAPTAMEAEPLSGLWPEPAPTAKAAPTIAESLERTAYDALKASRCTELSRKAPVGGKIAIRYRLAASGEVTEILELKHQPKQDAIAKCYADELKAHRFAAREADAPLELGVKLHIGALDKDIIHNEVRRNVAQVRACYNDGLKRNRDLKGRVTVRFVIGAGGAVQTSELVEESLGDPGVADCIVQAAREWTFEEPFGGGKVSVDYPFVLDTK